MIGSRRISKPSIVNRESVPRLVAFRGPLEQLLELAVFLGSEDSGELSGRVISFNDFSSEFQSNIPEIMASDAYKVRRVKP